MQKLTAGESKAERLVSNRRKPIEQATSLNEKAPEAELVTKVKGFSASHNVPDVSILCIGAVDLPDMEDVLTEIEIDLKQSIEAVEACLTKRQSKSITTPFLNLTLATAIDLKVNVTGLTMDTIRQRLIRTRDTSAPLKSNQYGYKA